MLPMTNWAAYHSPTFSDLPLVDGLTTLVAQMKLAAWRITMGKVIKFPVTRRARVTNRRQHCKAGLC